MSVLNYSKWDNIWVSSDDDEDCHPNIEKYAWRRLKKRMREEKGEKVNEPVLIDKWSSTNVNRNEKTETLDKTDPEAYLEKFTDKINQYAMETDDIKADGFLMANPKLASELTEGFLITKAVDLAVEDRNNPDIHNIARRCLQVHNLNASANAANIPPEQSVPLFFRHLKNEDKRAEYYREFERQLEEIKGRIETRRVEKLAEAQAQEQEQEEYEKAPLGPGGLDPNEVLQELPEDIQNAFVSQDKQALIDAIEKRSEEEGRAILEKCIASGLWNPTGGAQESEQVEVVENPNPPQTSNINLDELD